MKYVFYISSNSPQMAPAICGNAVNYSDLAVKNPWGGYFEDLILPAAERLLFLLKLTVFQSCRYLRALLGAGAFCHGLTETARAKAKNYIVSEFHNFQFSINN